MDYRGTAHLGLISIALLIAGASASASERSVLRALAWLAPEGRIEALSTEPVVGLLKANKNHAGEILFNTPMLLGGQAAKAGISCASCHVNGRSNPHFLFPGVSGAPGTADVTHSFFSSHRGDGQFNPVPIPDLTKPGKISHDSENQKLEKFIRGLIVEEFDGEEPDQNILNALSAYIRALRSSHSGKIQPITVDTQLRQVRLALATAQQHESRNPKLTRLLLSGARHQLGLIHERFAGKQLSKERAALLKLSAGIVDLQTAIGARSSLFYQISRSLDRDFQLLCKMLVKTEMESLYDPSQLALALNKSGDAP